MIAYIKIAMAATVVLMLTAATVTAVELTDAQVDNMVRRSCPYVAMYNVIKKAAMDKANPMMTGWNGTSAAKGLLDHTMQAIARPNNDTLYVTSVLDLRGEPAVIRYPAFDSKFVCLETSAYDHYCDIPLSTTKNDFKKSPVSNLKSATKTGCRSVIGGSILPEDTNARLANLNVGIKRETVYVRCDAVSATGEITQSSIHGFEAGAPR